jgi:hypothetical protein
MPWQIRFRLVPLDLLELREPKKLGMPAISIKIGLDLTAV